MIEMFKAKNKIEPFLLQDIFGESQYTGPTLRSSKYFSRPNVETVKYGERSLQNLGVRNSKFKNSKFKISFFPQDKVTVNIYRFIDICMINYKVQ